MPLKKTPQNKYIKKMHLPTSFSGYLEDIRRFLLSAKKTSAPLALALARLEAEAEGRSRHGR
jgi:hypothetical protein